MGRVANLALQDKAAYVLVDALKAFSPEGAAIAWFPPRMKTFFASQGIDRTVARVESNTNFTQSELAAWTKYNWLIEIPKADFTVLGKALAELENRQRLLSITKLMIHVVATHL